MLINLKKLYGGEIIINIDHVVSITEDNVPSTGSSITLTTGEKIEVMESMDVVYNYITTMARSRH